MRALRLADYATRFPPRHCANCGQSFAAARSDAVTCSPRCRITDTAKPDIDRIAMAEASTLLDGEAHYLGALRR